MSEVLAFDWGMTIVGIVNVRTGVPVVQDRAYNVCFCSSSAVCREE